MPLPQPVGTRRPSIGIAPSLPSRGVSSGGCRLPKALPGSSGSSCRLAKTFLRQGQPGRQDHCSRSQPDRLAVCFQLELRLLQLAAATGAGAGARPNGSPSGARAAASCSRSLSGRRQAGKPGEQAVDAPARRAGAGWRPAGCQSAATSRAGLFELSWSVHLQAPPVGGHRLHRAPPPPRPALWLRGYGVKEGQSVTGWASWCRLIVWMWAKAGWGVGRRCWHHTASRRTIRRPTCIEASWTLCSPAGERADQ